jgi:hypothetical protein
MPGIQQCLRSFPKMKKQPKKICTAISATNLETSILHRNAPRGSLHLEGLTRLCAEYELKKVGNQWRARDSDKVKVTVINKATDRRL